MRTFNPTVDVAADARTEADSDCPRFLRAVDTVANEIGATYGSLSSDGATKIYLGVGDELGRTIHTIAFDDATGELAVSARRTTSAQHRALQLSLDLSILVGCSLVAVYLMQGLLRLSRPCPLAIGMFAVFVVPLLTRRLHASLMRALLARTARRLLGRVRELAESKGVEGYRVAPVTWRVSRDLARHEKRAARC